MLKTFLKKIIPTPIQNLYYKFFPAFGALIYRFPSKKLIVIGVTGTNGKSSVVEMSHQILREAGLKVASISSIRFKIDNNAWPNTLKMTMPGRFKLQRFLRKAVNAGCQYAVLEVTSEGIKQFRHKFINFNVAVFTNLTPEHIESHGCFENYKKAKGKLFRSLLNSKSKILNPRLSGRQAKQIQNPKFKIQNDKSKLKKKKVSIVNLDDENADYFLSFPADEKWVYKIKNQKSKIKNTNQNLISKNIKLVEADEVQSLESGIRFKVQEINFNLKLLGRFNIYNALAAICVGLSQGVDLQTIKRALGKTKGVPGRMELVIKEPFRVYVDYAHTPDSLLKVYQTIRSFQPLSSKRRMICVFGSCGGGRDRWKRPEFGKIAAKYCDEIILTNEDPYDEDPYQILSEIKSGILSSQFPISNLCEVLDRREAIRKSLELAQPGDTIIITGKGSEPWMCMAGGKKIPWDDREIVRKELRGIITNH